MSEQEREVAEVLAPWFEHNLTHENFRDWSDAQFAQAVAAMLAPLIARLTAEAEQRGREEALGSASTEWRVVGTPGAPHPPYRFRFETEERARGFVRLIGEVRDKPWEDGPHLESRIVTETPWVRAALGEPS